MRGWDISPFCQIYSSEFFQNRGKVVTGRDSTSKLRLAFLKCSQTNYHRIFKASNLELANTGL